MPKKLEPTPEPPAHLSEASQALWREIVPRRAKSPERLVLLTVALEAYGRLQQCRELLAGAELLEKHPDAKMAHAHPALRLEKEARGQFTKLWAALGLDHDYHID